MICFRVLGAGVVHATQMNFLLSTTCFSAFVITLTAFASTYLEKLDCEKILKTALPIWSVFGALIYCAFGWKLIPHDSSNVTIFAVSLPHLIPKDWKDWKRILSVAVILIAIVGSNTSSPLGVAFVVFAAYFILHGHSWKWLLLAPLPIVAGCLVYGWRYIFNDTGRFSAYKFFMGQWLNDDQTTGNVLFGYGVGSFEIISQVFQHRHMFRLWYDPAGRLKGELFMHLHSEILQFLFEYGLVGWCLLFLCAIRLWKDLSGRTKERCVMLGCLSSFVFDFSCRYPGVPLILFLLLGLSMQAIQDRKV